MKTDPETIYQFLSETHACAMQMMENAAYIQKELPSLDMPDPLRTQIEKTCTELVGAKHDLVSDILELGEFMESSLEPSALRPRVGSIWGVIGAATAEIQDCVEAVQAGVAAGEVSPMVAMLIMESACNVLNTTPSFPDLEGEPADDESEETDDDPNADCFAFQAEDAWPVGELATVIRRLGARTDLDPETRGNLKVFLFAMERLPLMTPQVLMNLTLRRDFGGESDWIEIRMEGDEFSLGRGTWVGGDADTETVFEVSAGYRDGDAFTASQFAESFRECANDDCRQVVIDDFSNEAFTAWDLPLGKARWSDLPCSFL